METESNAELAASTQLEHLAEKTFNENAEKSATAQSSTTSPQQQAQQPQSNVLSTQTLKNFPLTASTSMFSTDDFLSRVNMNEKINNILRSPNKTPNGIRQRSVFTANAPSTVSTNT